MPDAVKRRGLALHDPAEVLEEAYVRELHVGEHPRPAEHTSCAYCKSNKLGAEMMIPVIDGDGQPVALPQIARLIEWIHANGAAQLVAHGTDGMQRARVVVSFIPIIVCKQPLLVDEHLEAQPEVRVELGVGACDTAGDDDGARRDRGPGARPAHGPPLV